MAKYIVKPGDTLGKIAAEFLGSASEYTKIAEANHMINPNALQVGMELEIPEHENVSEAPPTSTVQSTQPVTTDTTAQSNLISSHRLSYIPLCLQPLQKI